MKPSRIAIAVAALQLCVAAPAIANSADGEAIYTQRCAVCHGDSGRPDPNSPVVSALGVTPADFSDPLFNSREPLQDWEMVIEHGGWALGLSDQMPAQGEALSDEEVRAVAAYVKTLADTTGFPPGEMNLMLPIRTKKAFPEDEVVYQGRWSDDNGIDIYKGVLEIEMRVGRRGQVIVELVHESVDGDNELEEIELGYKHVLMSSETQILSAAAVVAIPTDSDGEEELQTYLAWGAAPSPNWTFQSSLTLKTPFDDPDSGEIELAGIAHYTHSPWPRRVFPALEVTATRPLDSSNGDTEWTAMPQVRVGLTRGGHVALNVGVEYPISGQDWDERYYLTLLWDFADGSFFQGW
ncbi:MAG: cytochrome c [Woeseiaceae bacterium]|nr:cytochrome c [Woeseiaceae bacterium]